MSPYKHLLGSPEKSGSEVQKQSPRSIWGIRSEAPCCQRFAPAASTQHHDIPLQLPGTHDANNSWLIGSYRSTPGSNAYF